METQAQPATETRTLCPLRERYSYHVVESSAQMPNSCWGRYSRIAVVEVDHHERPGYRPRAIRDLRGVRVVRTWERQHAAGTNCAAKRAARDARILAGCLATERVVEAIADEVGL